MGWRWRAVIALATLTAVAPAADMVGPATAASAGSVLDRAKAAAGAEPSLHYVATTIGGGKSVTITGDVAKDGGSQSIVMEADGTTGHVTVSLAEATAYFRGDGTGLTALMGLPPLVARRYVNQWIAVPSTNAAYGSLADALTTSSALQQVLIGPPLHLGRTTTKLHQRVLSLDGVMAGAAPGSEKTGSVPATLYLHAHGPPLPVLYEAARKVNGQNLSQTISFSRWHEPVHVGPPRASVPVGQLGSTPTET